MRTIALLAACVLLLGCSTQIQHGLDERDANEVVAVLIARGIDARKAPEKARKPTWAVEVPDTSAADALRLLAELKLPRPARLTTRQLAEQPNLIETPQAERQRALEAVEGDIEQALETMDGVTSAAVELVVPPAPRPGVAPTPSKAAVLLRARPDALERLTQQRAELRALVAASTEGLEADGVVLVIDEVATHVASPITDRPQQGLRALVATLAAALTVLAVLLVVLTVRTRVRRRPVAPPTPPPTERTPSRPVLSPALQRKAA